MDEEASRDSKRLEATVVVDFSPGREILHDNSRSCRIAL